MDQGINRSLKCKCGSRIIQKITKAIDKGKHKCLPSLYLKSEVSEIAIINCFREVGVKEGMSDENDEPFSALKSSIESDLIRVCSTLLSFKAV